LLITRKMGFLEGEKKDTLLPAKGGQGGVLGKKFKKRRGRFGPRGGA